MPPADRDNPAQEEYPRGPSAKDFVRMFSAAMIFALNQHRGMTPSAAFDASKQFVAEADKQMPGIFQAMGKM